MDKERSSGILLHISSLPSKFGIGDLGPQAYHFANILSKNNQKFWQILPLNPTELAHGNSPYHSCSTFAGNPLFISPELLYQEGFLKKSDLKNCHLPEKEEVNFAAIYPLKGELLKKSCQTFDNVPEMKDKFNEFCHNNQYWLDDFALFQVLNKCYPDKEWDNWPEDIKNRKRETLKSVRKNKAREIKKEKIIQFLFFRQWKQLKEHCKRKNINIIGDLPIYVTYHSADVWANPKLFKLDNNKRPKFKAGVPPDYFSKTGQLWGNPVYQWSSHRKEKYNWWENRIRKNLSMVDLLRIDHFRGLVAYWEIPAGNKTAINGNWEKGGGSIFFHMLKRKFPNLPFIAEDLGVITKDVVKVMDKLGLPGMRVIQFGFDKNSFPHNSHLPHNYRNNCLAYTGTHDNNTIIGWLKNEVKICQKRLIEKYLGKEIRIKDFHWDMIQLIQSSVAKIAIIPAQDMLGLGEEARMNYPSHANSNWQWKMTSRQFLELKNTSLPKLCELSEIYGRGNIAF